MVARIEQYDRWLASSDDVPKLLLTFDGPADTLLMGSDIVAWCAANVASLEIQNCGPAAHVVQEDQPLAIAEAIAAWLDRLHLSGVPGSREDALP